jgi:hypothetical protein
MGIFHYKLTIFGYLRFMEPFHIFHVSASRSKEESRAVLERTGMLKSAQGPGVGIFGVFGSTFFGDRSWKLIIWILPQDRLYRFHI